MPYIKSFKIQFKHKNLTLTSRFAKDSLMPGVSSEKVIMNKRDSSRLKANGMSIMTLRNLSAGPSSESSPVNNLSFSSSSVEGAIFNNVWMSSTGISFPDYWDI